MAGGLKEIFLICRLCLSRNEALLVPIAEVLESSLTIDDFRNLSGVHIDAIDAKQRIIHAICLDCASKLKMLAVFRKRCISNNYQFHQLWWRSCANRSSDTVEGVEYLYDSGADPLEVEYLVNEDTNSGPAAFHGSSLLQHEDTSETEEIPLVEAVKYDSNNSNNESPLTQQTPEEGCQQSVTTNSTEKHVLKDELLYSANYIELGEPHSEDDEPDLYGMEWTNHSHLNIIRSSKRSSRGSPKLNIGSILFNRISHKQEKPLCDTCGKVVTNLALHITSHKDELNYACPHCPIKMKHSSYLIRHIQSVHFKTIVKSCTACNIGFNHYETYRAHMYTQHGIGPQHECVVCSRRFHHACRLKKHVKQCHDLDEYDCEVCGRIFKLRENLNRHQKRVHTMGQPYKCSQCPKSFKCASYRKNHELIHHSGIVLKCTFCDKSFRYKYQVNAHISEMHSDANADSAVTEQATIACNETSATESMESGSGINPERFCINKDQ